MKFQSLKQLIDVRDKLIKHKTNTYTDYGVKSKTHIVIHHSLTESGSAEAFANYHVNTNGWAAIAYHFVIEKDGAIKWCNDLGLKTYHVGDSNKFCIGICLVGDFRVQKPTKEQYQSVYDLAESLRSELNIPVENIKGHQEMPTYSWKQCPAFNMDQFRGHIQYKTFGEVDCNYQNDITIGVTKPTSLNMQPKPEKVAEQPKVEQPPVTKDEKGDEYMKVSSPALRAIVEAEIRDLTDEKKYGKEAFNKIWLDKFLKNELTVSDAIALLYAAKRKGI